MLKKGLLLTNSNKVNLLSFEDFIILVELVSGLPLVCLKISKKFFCAIFIVFFAETEDALAKLIFLMANKCLS